MASKFTLPFADVGAGITPSSGATLDFYDTGTYNRRDTYTDAGAGTANANPVVADSTGVFPSIFIDGAYRVVLSDSNGVQIWEEDGVENPVSDDIATNAAAISVLQSQIDNQLNNVIDGLVPSNGADTDHDITISDGSAADSTKTSRLVLSESLTKQIDASWAAGNNAGGLFSGTVAANTTYHMFIIEKDSDGTIDAGFDTSVTAANIPSSYIRYRRVASILTDSSANILNFSAVQLSGGGLSVRYAAPVLDFSGTAVGATATTLSTTIPQGFVFNVETALYLKQNLVGAVYVSALSCLDLAASESNFSVIASGASGVGVGSNTIFTHTNTSAQIRYRGSTTTFTGFNILTLGWEDYRI